ncbi:probable G-protein coupled receptor Mth-like 5 [Cimex lectularius]|uniref:Uncharacterized protein n=1 Tax=Cimex lectularius TaxID=79782 RepID=A0A8I6S220_CIMLE|nr:probable G-protein coupled receptor Mth-like 5 [Cimex lectularius]
MFAIIIFLLTFQMWLSSNTIPSGGKLAVYINKCCEINKIHVKNECKEVNQSLSWEPTFLSKSVDVQVHVINSYPKCYHSHLSSVYDNFTDRLRFLLDGTLRHYTLNDPHTPDEDLKDEQMFYDYQEGTYCSEKMIDSNNKEMYYALLCPPKVNSSWTDFDFIMRKIVDPIFHIIALICYVSVALIHFVLPQLRDLFGNIVATINICLAVAQAADIARIITNFGIPVTHFLAEVCLCVAILSAYLWLTGLGFYLWRTFRSENVFLRMTHGKKYCYYSFSIWSTTAFLTLIALLAHFYLDNPLEEDIFELMKIGWLVIAIFYLPIVCCIAVNAYFYHRTSACMKVYGRYGRIHHKFKICVDIFGRLQLAMLIYWAFLPLSWLPFNVAYYSYIFVNALIAPVILYISILSQRRVRFLLRKECCFEKCLFKCLRPNQPEDIPEWGEEMMAIYK